MIEDSFPVKGPAGRPPEVLRIIEAAKSVSPEKRVDRLIELGILTDLDGFTWGNADRKHFFVFVNVEGRPIPMYKTLHHTNGKGIEANLNFFPFFGFGRDTAKRVGWWMIKGTISDMNKLYGISELEEASRILTEVFDFDTTLYVKLENGSKKEIYYPEGRQVITREELNLLLNERFGLDIETYGGEGIVVERGSEHVNEIIGAILGDESATEDLP